MRRAYEKSEIAFGWGAGAVVAVSSSSEPSLDSVEQRVSYGIALNLGANLARQGLEVDFPAFLAGLQDGLAGKPARLPESVLRAAFEVAQKKTEQAGATRVAEQADAAKGFLDKNQARPGVVVTPSGLHYEVLRAGTGATPTTDQTVEVHYHGMLTDGTVFDSSVERGEPITFPVTGVIPGWVEALQLMQVGAKWRLVIPSDLAYGPEGSGPIPPGATLIFDVELLGIK